jgi:hypothetical protein
MHGADYKFSKKLGTAMLASAAAMVARPAYAEVERGNAEITVVRPLSFVIDDNLQFGSPEL